MVWEFALVHHGPRADVKFLMVPPATVVNMQLVLQHNVAVHTMGAKSDMLQLAALMALFAAGLQYMRCGLKDH